MAIKCKKYSISLAIIGVKTILRFYLILAINNNT